MAGRIDAPRTVINVSRLHRSHNDLWLDGMVESEECTITIDTGATKLILRPDLVPNLKHNSFKKYILRTATGGTAPVYGEVFRTVQLGDLVFEGSFLVADITDECIIGVDFLTKHGFKIDLEKRVLR